MYPREALNDMLMDLRGQLHALFGGHLRGVILFGSYARNEASDDSDVDILILVDLPREEIPSHRRQIAEITSEYLFSNNLLIAPIIENEEFFNQRRHFLPFYRNVDREGVRIGA